MDAALLATKFFVPSLRAKAVERAELGRRLNENLSTGESFSRKLTLVSAPAGFGKTSLVSAWIASLDIATAWLSLDEKDSDPARFLTYLVSALQTAEPGLGAWVLSALQVPQPPSAEALVTRLVNDLAQIGRKLILVLDDYHSVNSPSVDDILVFLIDNLPPKFHLVLVTREDPGLPLARYRARGQMAELRAKDLKFSCPEVTDFLSRVMEIDLDESDIAALEARTEGWAAGLQFAALALQGSREKRARSEFIASFTGSHRFVLDYLLEEVLLQRSDEVQKFLLATSCLGRFCGSLCDAVLESPSGTGREILEALEKANLFLVPLDDERRWYRYHHLFAQLLQQRLSNSPHPSCPEPSVIHSRASLWFERNGFIMEAFRHAAASGDTARAASFIEDRRMPTHTRGAMVEVVGWLTALPDAVKNEHPSLWVYSATLTLAVGLTRSVEEWLQAAESALRGKEDEERFLFGRIMTARATLAVSQFRMEDAKTHALLALELLADQKASFRLAALWDLGIAHHFTGDRTEARRIMEDVFSQSRSTGSVFFQILSSLGLGELQEKDNRLFQAAETFLNVLRISGEHPQPNTCVANLGLARIHYEWNDLEKAGAYVEQGLILAHQYDSAIDRFVVSFEVLRARIETAQGNLEAAEERLTRAERVALENRFLHRIPEIQTGRTFLRLRMGSIPEPAGLPPPEQVRIFLAKGQVEAAAALLESWTAEVDDRADEKLRALVLRAVVLESGGDREMALASLDAALHLAESGGFLRLFVDEGPVMRALVREAHLRGTRPEYTDRILAAFSKADAERVTDAGTEPVRKGHDLLSEREREVLLHLAEGLSNQDIAEKLFISLHTVKVHVRNIFDKLGTQSRTAAAAKGRSLGLLP